MGIKCLMSATCFILGVSWSSACARPLYPGRPPGPTGTRSLLSTLLLLGHSHLAGLPACSELLPAARGVCDPSLVLSQPCLTLHGSPWPRERALPLLGVIWALPPFSSLLCGLKPHPGPRPFAHTLTLSPTPQVFPALQPGSKSSLPELLPLGSVPALAVLGAPRQ